MAASGKSPSSNYFFIFFSTFFPHSGLADQTSTIDNQHVEAVAMYALRIRDQLNYVNEHSFNNFKIRIGINVGPIVAGVIGAKKPQYDIWGNAVNVANAKVRYANYSTC